MSNNQIVSLLAALLTMIPQLIDAFDSDVATPGERAEMQRITTELGVSGSDLAARAAARLKELQGQP